MRGALKAVAEGMGVNRAAMEYGVPRTTLKDRVAGRVQHGCNSGRAPYLTSPTIATGIFSPRSLLSSAQKASRCILQVFPPEAYTASFGGDVKQSVPGDLV